MRALEMAPRVSGGVAHAMAVSVGVGADDRAALSTKAVNCAADLVLNRGHFVRTIWSRSCGKSWSQSRTRSARDDATDPALAVVTIVARFWARIRATSCTSADHHALDAGSVLGTVQGSSLRSARACARPSGLDGACAQITSWPLRAGRQSDDA